MFLYVKYIYLFFLGGNMKINFTKLVMLRCVLANSIKSNFLPQYLEPLFILMI